jgi:hypothetical protein
MKSMMLSLLIIAMLVMVAMSQGTPGEGSGCSPGYEPN